jgi:hypothetical protein
MGNIVVLQALWVPLCAAAIIAGWVLGEQWLRWNPLWTCVGLVVAYACMGMCALVVRDHYRELTVQFVFLIGSPFAFFLISAGTAVLRGVLLTLLGVGKFLGRTE